MKFLFYISNFFTFDRFQIKINQFELLSLINCFISNTYIYNLFNSSFYPRIDPIKLKSNRSNLKAFNLNA